MGQATDDQLDQLIREVKDLARERFPEGNEGAAGMLLPDGTVLTSTAPAAFNPSVEICHETGAYCEAYKQGKTIVASVCLHRETDERFLVLSPCGVCLERLAVHGPDVLVGVPAAGEPAEVTWVSLRDAHPYYWRKVLVDPAGW